MWRLQVSTPFRLALAFAFAILVIFALASLVAALLIEHDLRERQDDVLTSRFDAMMQVFASDGRRGLVGIAAVSEHTDGGVQESLVSLRDARGNLLSGDAALQDVVDGFSTRSGYSLDIDTDHGYRLLARSFEGFRLVLGMVNQASAEMREIGLAALAWASLLVLALTLAGAAFVAHSLRRAVRVIGGTLREVAGGHFDARIPVAAFGRIRGQDVTALVEEFNATLVKLERNVEGVRQVSVDIAHDLRTPLSRMRIGLEGALDDCPRDSDAANAVAKALENLEQLDATFSALLRTTEIESGARRAHFRPFDAGILFEHVADVYREVAEDAGDTVDFVRAGNASSVVDGDRDLLAQLFANLIENAIHHCPAGTSIHCEIAATAQAITFIVADDGDGVPADERDKVLRRLYRLEKSRTSPGSGLGLSLVKAIAELHEGTLTLADNSPGLRISLVLRPASGAATPDDRVEPTPGQVIVAESRKLSDLTTM